MIQFDALKVLWTFKKNFFLTPIDWKASNERNRMSKAPSKYSNYLPSYEDFKILLAENMWEAHIIWCHLSFFKY